MVIDVTRTVDRSLRGRLPTGVDRVSLAYIDRYAEQSVALVRFAGRWIFLCRADSARLFAELLTPSKMFSVIVKFLVVKNYLLGFKTPNKGSILLNTGHSGLDLPDYAQHIHLLGLRGFYFLHDLIPMSHPEYCRPGEAHKHHRRVQTMLNTGVGIVMNSEATQNELIHYAKSQGAILPPHVVGLLAPAPLAKPDPVRPIPTAYFVVLGTIEPRKNHLLLLNIWRELVLEMGDDAPILVVIGQRGWECEQVIDMLDRCPSLNGKVLEKSACSDRDVATWLSHAQALLFPSFAEGFGMPLVEALMMGVPVIASNLCVFREVAGDIPEYLSPIDGLGWKEIILSYSEQNSLQSQAQKRRRGNYVPPSWKEHFAHVDSLFARLDLTKK